ncbi:MAG: hypothetical protein K5849_07130, partial [Bacteroidales bacterium]|nr:hypothetical protein [Bacteroidales bacterium]
SLFFVLLLVFCITHTARAQGQWMVGADGAVGLSAYAPRFSVGVEASFYLLNKPHFKLGPGVGFTFSGEQYELLPIDDLRKGSYIPVFLRGEYNFPLGDTSGFALLDFGYQFGAFGWTSDGRSLMMASETCAFQAWFVSPQVGLNLGRRFYLATGLWIPCKFVRDKGGNGHEIPLSLSVHFGVRL